MKNLKLPIIVLLSVIGSVYMGSNDNRPLVCFVNSSIYLKNKSEVTEKRSLYQNNTYAVLKRKLDGGYYPIIKGDLYFTMEGEYNNSVLSYKIYDSKRIVRVNSVNYANLNLNTGYNAYFLDLNAIYGFSASDNNQFFVLEVTNPKKEVFLLKFKYGQ